MCIYYIICKKYAANTDISVAKHKHRFQKKSYPFWNPYIVFLYFKVLVDLKLRGIVCNWPNQDF